MEPKVERMSHDLGRPSHDKTEDKVDDDHFEHGYHAEEIIHHSASIRSQLEVWHANRGNKSILRAIIPPWYPNREDKTTKNLFVLLREITWRHWLIFFSGWFCWTCDGYDYFCVSVTMTQLAEAFGKTTTQISFAITLTLLFRSLGALIFGILADRFGRKWTLVANMLIIAAFELGSGFVQTYEQFLAVRSLFGVAMGGIWGQAAATCLENVPAETRGFLSGVVQQGYAVGYLLAAVINMTVGQYSAPKWRSLYFIGAGFSLAAAMLRAALPESKQYLLAREEARASGISSKESAKLFGREVINMLKTNWIRAIWAICMMTGMNFFSHGSQDLYPTYLKTTKGLSEHSASVATIISNCGAIAGGMIGGYASQYIGRRWALIILTLFTAAWVPLWILPDSFPGLAAGGFWIQFGVQGSWGVIPIYLSEVAPPAFRASFSGLAYQLGNMASSAASQIESDAGKSLKTTLNGKVIPDYASIMGILLGAVIGWTVLCVILGPDADGANFEEAKVAVQSGAGEAAATDLMRARKKRVSQTV